MTDDLRPIPLAASIILIIVLWCIAWRNRPRKYKRFDWRHNDKSEEKP